MRNNFSGFLALGFLRGWILLCLNRSRKPVPEALRRAAALRPSAEEGAELSAVDAIRTALRADRAVVEVVDFGAGYAPGLFAPGGGAKPVRRTIAEIARRAAIPPGWGVFLFTLVRELAPMRLLELGTSLGLSAAYLCAALRRNEAPGAAGARLVTIEGDPALAALASGHLDRVAPGTAHVRVGRFDEVLPGVLTSEEPFDFVFIDGHHEEEAVWRYYRMIRSRVADGACMVLDDIEPWGTGVYRAWKRIVASEPGAFAVHLGKMGVLVLPSAEPSRRPESSVDLSDTRR